MKRGSYMDNAQIQQNEGAKPLEMLIGDDMFASPLDAMEIKRGYLKPLHERLAPTYNLNITDASSPRQMIREAQTGKYNIIVTDLNYQTEGRVGTEGYEVLDAISIMSLPKKPFVILCTSADNQQMNIQRKLAERKMDICIGSEGGNHKFANLVEYLVGKFGGIQNGT